jgi:hypothetical protein
MPATYTGVVSEKAKCPHCGIYTSRVYIDARCPCGWADPDVHDPYEQQVEIELTPDAARAALRDPQDLAAEIRRQLERPRLSQVDGQPILFQEREPEPHRCRP